MKSFELTQAEQDVLIEALLYVFFEDATRRQKNIDRVDEISGASDSEGCGMYGTTLKNIHSVIKKIIPNQKYAEQFVAALNKDELLKHIDSFYTLPASSLTDDLKEAYRTQHKGSIQEFFATHK